jgi:exodeoxyribonuclease-3
MTKKIIKLISWNVNGLRAVVKKDFFSAFHTLNADIFALQETKLQAHQLTDEMKSIAEYDSYYAFSAAKKGYSGVAIYTRIKPKAVKYGLEIPRFDTEGRMIEMDFGKFVFFNIYFPNGQMSDARLGYKLDFYDSFFEYADRLKSKGRNLIIAGDFNTAHKEIDLKNPGPNSKRSGFLPVERARLDQIIASGYTDTFRALHPESVKYSWWSYRFRARERNAGWRIDYFFVSQAMMEQNLVKEAFIDNDIMGSDHCPVGLVISV